MSSEVIDNLQPSTSSFINKPNNTIGVKTQSVIVRNQPSIASFMQRPIPMGKSKMIDQQLVKMIVKEYHPFSIVENKEFRNLIKMLNPSYVIPSRKTITQSLIPQMYEMTIDKTRDQLNDVSAVCITTDGWTSINNQSFIAVTAHFIDPKNETQLSSVLLGCNGFDEKHTSDNLSKFLRNTIDEWKLSDKLVGAVSDNAANIKAALVKCNWRYLSCFAHSINLIVQSSLKCIEPILDKVKEIVRFFKKSSHALAKLHELQKQTGYPTLKLKQDCPTRWNSSYDMVDRMISIKEPIIASLAILHNSELNCLTSEEWVVLENARDLLKIFYDVTVEISAEKYIALSKEIIFVKSLNKFILNYIQNDTLPLEIRSMATTLKDQLYLRFGKLEDNFLVTQATLLDPRFKQYAFSDKTKCERAINLLRTKVQSITLDSANTPQQSTDMGSLQVVSPHQSTLWQDFDDTVVKLIGANNSSTAGIIEVDKYMNEPLINRLENPLMWWAERKKVYPRMYELVKRRLCLIATSVPCERIFSKAGQVVCERRNRLTSSKISQILFLNHNM